MDRSRAKRSRVLGCATALATLLLLGGCQTDDLKPEAGEKAAANGAAKSNVSDGGFYNQTLGAGKVRIGYLGVRRADQPGRQADSEYRDGAALAVNSLGTDLVKLTMLESADKPEAVEAAARTLAGQGAALLITTAKGAELEAVRTALVGRDVPIVTFETNETTLPERVYGFRSSPADSLVEASTFAMAEGASHAMILASSPAEKLQADLIAKQIKAFGATVEPVVELSGGALPAKALAAWNKVDMVVMMPSVKSPGEIIKKADAGKPPRPGRRIVASTTLTPTDLADAKLTGTIVCRYDQNIAARIGQRYMASYGMPASPQAGYGFDAMAMAIGLVNVAGDAAFAPERMMNPSGFSGTLGIFRFEDGGKVRRNCDIFKVSKGSYVFFQKAPPTL